MSRTRAVMGLTARLVRRGALVLLLCLAVYMVVEVRVFELTYPDQAARDVLVQLARDPVMQVFQSQPAAASIGALTVWDAGWVLHLVVGLWLVVTTARVVRADEDTGRTDLVLAGRLSARRVLVAQLAVLVAAACLAGAAVGVTLAISTEVRGGLLYGAAVAGFGATYVAATAVLAQLAPSRGRVLGGASLLLGGALLLRMVAGSSDDLRWLSWLTPLGWTDRVKAYGDDAPLVLLVPLGAAALLTVTSVLLRGRRDTGASLVHEPAQHRSHLTWLGSPVGFAWRASAGVLAAWAVGLGVFAGVAGGLIRSMETFLTTDESYRQILAAMGMETGDLTGGYVAMTCSILGAAVCLYAVWRLGAARTEEAAERADNLLVLPVRRGRWLGGHVLLTVVGSVALAVLAGVGMWVGARVSGAELTLADAVAGMLNVLPVVAVVAGLALLLLGVLPRLTVPVAASAAVLTYVLAIVGPALDWPDLVVDLSPFHHLEAVPVDPPGLAAAAVMVLVGLVAGAIGMARFSSRDLLGA